MHFNQLMVSGQGRTENQLQKSATALYESRLEPV